MYLIALLYNIRNANTLTPLVMENIIFTTGNFQVLEAKRTSKNKYSVFMRDFFNKREYGFTYTNAEDKFDMRLQGDRELLCILAADWYNETYLTC